MKRNSLVSHIRKLAFGWNISAMFLTIALSGSLFFVLVYKDAEREIQTLAATIISSYRTDILSGGIRSIELQLNKDFGIEKRDRILFLDQNRKPWVETLTEANITFCGSSNGLCRNVFDEKVLIDLPIYFDNEKTMLWGYLHVEKHPHANWTLIWSVTLAIIFGMSFQAFGFYWNLLKSIKSVGRTIENWANRLSANPKGMGLFEPAPFSEIEPIHIALARLRNEIDTLENLAREQGALTTLRGVGHDILNPVSRLKRLLGLMQIKLSKSPDFDQELFQNCNSNLKRLSGYAEQLKILYKKKSGEALLTALPALDISKELRLLTDELSSDSEVALKNISFQFETSAGCLVRIPSPVMGRLLENIIGNSIQASDANSIIRLSTLVKDESVILKVEDHGIGIPTEIQHKIFEPDFSTKANKGTGLGLFVVKQICEQYKGQIIIESKLNIGTTFQISFPKCEVSL